VAKTNAELFYLITTTYFETSKNTSDIEILQEIQRKHFLLEGLCNIDDETFLRPCSSVTKFENSLIKDLLWFPFSSIFCFSHK
jgi:hypothetical protein